MKSWEQGLSSALSIIFLFMWHVSMTRLVIMAALTLLIASHVSGQQRGMIAGKVSPPMTGVVVVITNQVTSKVTRRRAGADGHYSFRIPAGAYRLSKIG